MSANGNVLEATGITKRFGGLVAVNDVDFAVPHKSIVAIIGPNGAGKTTFFNCMTGLYKPTTGKVVFDGADITAKAPHIVTQAGIARTFQNIKLFRTMTVLENVMVGHHCRMRARITGSVIHTPFVRREERQTEEHSRELLNLVGIPRRHQDLAASLPYGDQRRLEIARALGSDPKLLLLDEPTAGMNPQESEELRDADGQAAQRARHLAAPDRARHEGGHERLGPHHGARRRREDRRGLAAGGAGQPARHRGLPREPGMSTGNGANGATPVLEVEDIHTYYGSIEALKGISLTVNEGEIVTLIGSNGAGKSTTLRSISGLTPPKTGTIKFRGKEIHGLLGYQVAELGIAQSPEGRHVFPRMTVLENLEMGAFTRNDSNIPDDIERVYELFPRLKERAKQKAGTMSGGEQQMLAMGRALMANPKLLLLDEPSLGLAPVIVDKIYEIIREINQRGVTILLVEQNANYALDVSKRGYVLETGKVALSNDSESLRSDPEVMKAYLGT